MRPATDYAPKLDQLRDRCPIKVTLDVIRGRWKPAILWELTRGTKRFSALQAAMPGCHAHVLTTQLRQLEANGVISRTVYPRVPAHVEYALTAQGSHLSAVMDQLHAWGTQHLRGQPGAALPTADR